MSSYIAKTHVLDELWIDIALLDDLLQELEHHGIEGRIFEPAFAALAKCCADGERNDNVVRILLGAAMVKR